MLDGEVEEKRCFLQRIGAVRDDDTSHFRVLVENCVDACCELQPDGGVHVGAANVGDLLDAHAGVALDFRHGINEFRTEYRPRLVFGEAGRRAATTCDSAARGKHYDERQDGGRRRLRERRLMGGD